MHFDIEKLKEKIREVETDPLINQAMYIFTRIWDRKTSSSIDFDKISLEALHHAYESILAYVEMEAWSGDEDTEFNETTFYGIWHTLFKIKGDLMLAPPKGGDVDELNFI